MVTATFLGVSTVLLDDGDTALLTDGFFSRPSLLRVATRPLRPDTERISGALRRVGITRLAAVLVAHSHYDHALDSPVVAQRTGALLVGSSSTAQIAAGYGFPADRFVPAPVGAALTFGCFTVTAVDGPHSHPNRFPGTISAPVVPPARAARYRCGECYSFHIGHSTGSVLVHASANVRPGALVGLRADAVYLGVGQLGRASQELLARYWAEVVVTLRPRRVVPIHWDDFSRPLSPGVRPIPWPFDNHRRTAEWLHRETAAAGIDLVWPSPWQPMDPFAA
jgi:L-ascorbate metabolism protein UlaG (beta-lactamase superfamily)